MERTHTFDLYRRKGAGVTESRRPRRPWGAPLLNAVPCNLQLTGGGVDALPEGRKARADAMLFAHPRDLGGEQLLHDDAVVVRSGATVLGTYLVLDTRPQGGGPWDDEADLVRTTEAIP